MSLRTVCVIGAGNMGGGIAQACAQAGMTVHLVDQDHAAVERARERMRTGLGELVKRGKYSAADVSAVVDRVHPFSDVAAAVQDADIAIEAVYESYDVKGPLFEALDAAAGPDTILATNTSSLAVTRLAEKTTRPERQR